MNPSPPPAKRPPRNRRRLLLALALGLALPLAAGAAANKDKGAHAGKEAAPERAEVAEKQAGLKELRGRIESLQKDISNAEGSRAEVVDQLRDSERNISNLQRELHELGEQRDALQGALRDLAQQSRALEANIAAQQAQLEKLLYGQYLRGSQDTLKLLLNGDDPNQIARDLYYLGAVARARGDLLHDLQANLEKKQALAEDTRVQAGALAAVEARQREQHEKLVGQREQKKAMLSRISAQISAQKKEVGSLRRDEQRMTQLIDRLTKLLAARAAAAKKAPPRLANKERDSRGNAAAKPETPVRGAPEIDNDELPQAAPPGSFARQQGHLRLPVRGTVTNRFGAPRQEGAAWKGLFIRSGAGGEVKAVAAGRVVFADWMRGFGNLLIIDHGDAYLTIYGNNDALLKHVGDAVRGGDTVATVGNSGGNPESGLYFEIRHQGQPLDPLKWASIK